jgi:hypothetical protein
MKPDNALLLKPLIFGFHLVQAVLHSGCEARVLLLSFYVWCQYGSSTTKKYPVDPVGVDTIKPSAQ